MKMFSFMSIVKYLTHVILVVMWQSSASEKISITCKAGTFVGRVKTQLAFNNSYKVNRFLGIPYAEPPTGDLRFKRPVRKAPLTSPFDAGEFAASCFSLDVKIGGKRKPNQYRINESENCLFLNIFVPHTKSEGQKLPVLIKIHGGGFNIGTSTMYPGDILSAYGNIIVVTLNYRLNIWGFLSTGDDASPGNYGLWDQQMAIEWVHENIAAFGGDPELVTITGNSAGSASVIYQSMYRGNKGRFKRVFAQSGSPLCFWTFNYTPMKAALKIGRLLNCESLDSYKLVECIKSKSSDDILAAMKKDEIMKAFPKEFIPVVDGELLKLPPSELLDEHSGSEERELFSSYDLLTGITTHEGVVLIRPTEQDVEDFTINKYEFKNREIPKIAKIIFPDDNSQAVEEFLMNEYFPWKDPDNQTMIREALIQMNTDHVLAIQTSRTADIHSALGKGNTFFYLLDTLPSQHLVTTPSWSTKPNHCDDLTFLFGHDSESGFTSWTMPYTREPPENWELEFTKQYMTLVTNFMKSGNPTSPSDVSSQAKVTWPKYTSDKQEAFIITRDWDQPVVQRPFAKAVNFWYNALPAVVREIRNKETGYCVKPTT